jgi:hypothetical protein
VPELSEKYDFYFFFQMPGKNFHIDGSLAHDLRNTFRGVIEFKVDGLSLWVVDLNFLGGFPPLTGLAPHELIEFVDSSAYTYFKRQ